MKWLLKSIVLERWKKKKKGGMRRQSGDERERGKKGDEESGKGEEKRVGDKTSLRSLLYRGWIVAASKVSWSVARDWRERARSKNSVERGGIPDRRVE